MSKKRPVNLALTTLRFPPMAISSILHRISGILLFFAIPILLYWLDMSLHSRTGFDALKVSFSGFGSKLLIWAIITGLLYHLIAGFRHIIMDMGYGESLVMGRKSALAVMGLTVLLSLLIGVWIW